MLFARDNLFGGGYCDYSRLCYVIYGFTELIPNTFNDIIAFPISTSKRKIGCRETHITSFEKYFKQIYRNTYGD